jgi:hypothetical protein
MTTTISGTEAGRKVYAAKAQAKFSNTSCSFCWFFLTIYPTLEQMSPKDEALFTEHLKKSHGLTGEIQQ